MVETETGRDPDRMPLLYREVAGRRRTPVFSSMQLATTFLARAQEQGYVVKLDYIFPADGRQLPGDFPAHDFDLDPAPESFFADPPMG